jgi:hypothetical protein
MAEDVRAWQRIAEHGSGCQSMAEDRRARQRISKDGRGWQTPCVAVLQHLLCGSGSK